MTDRPQPAVIPGRRVLLRPFGSDHGDHERLVAWRREPENARWFASGARPTLESHLAWFERLQTDPSQLYWAIDARGADEHGSAHIGTIGLILSSGAEPLPDPVDAELARFLIGDPRFRGRGHGAEAAYRVLSHAFGPLRARRVEAEYVTGNARAERLYSRFGFTLECEREGMVRMALGAQAFSDRDSELRRWLGLDEGRSSSE